MSWQDSQSRRSRDLFAADGSADGDVLADDLAVQRCQLGGHRAVATVSQLVEVGFADRPTLKPLFAGTRTQYVNLASGSAAAIMEADAEIVSANQVGRHPPVFVRVTPPRVTTVRIKLTRTLNRGGFPSGSSTLSVRESGLSHLHWARAESTHSTDENGELLLEPGPAISALGGGEFKVQAALEGQGFVDSTNAVRVKRKVYLRPVHRFHAGHDAALRAIRSIHTQLDSLGIEVKRVQSSTGGELGVCEENTLARSLIDIGQRALSSNPQHVRQLQPHSVAVIVGEFITDPIAMQTFRVDVARGVDGQFPDSVRVPLVNGGSSYVVVPLADGSQFGTATLRSVAHVESLTAGDVVGIGRFASEVTVDISGVKAAFGTAATARLSLRLKAINSWAVGWAYTEHPVIYLNMRDPNTGNLLTATAAEALMVHELGHKLHLTAPGDDGQPDLQAHHYPTFSHGGVSHMGPHCKTGVPAGTDVWLDAAHNAASCTMWGALKTITTFCSECRTTLRKVDLGAGF